MTSMNEGLVKRSFAFQRRRSVGLHGVLHRVLPKPAKRLGRFVLMAGMDGMDILLRRRQIMVPPRRINFIGDGDFVSTGDEFAKYFVELGGLKPEDRVLEIGCGLGRMARPLTAYLSSGSYEGVDIVPGDIEWCQRNIGGRFPHFRFHLANVRNSQYNPEGALRSAEYIFPFAADEFDFVFLTSVFTHMLSDEMEHYLSEIARMVRKGGTGVFTFFLLNGESRSLTRAGISSLNFAFMNTGCWTASEELPEANVGYEESRVIELCGRFGLSVEGIRYGGWCGRHDYLSFQDLVVIRKV